MTTTSKRFRFVGPHLDDLADGRVLEPGEFYTLTEQEQQDPHNMRHIKGGALIDAPDTKAPTTSKAGEAA